jgi:DNA-binding Lrp family transcriptional regulator
VADEEQSSISEAEEGAVAEQTVVDEIDQRLLELLRADARVSVAELARAVSVSRATAYQRLARLRNEGVIRRFTVDVDPGKVGQPLAAVVRVSVVQHAWRSVGERLRRLPGLEWLALTAGPSDYVLLVRAPDMEHLRDVVLGELQSIAEVQSTQTLFLLDELR